MSACSSMHVHNARLHVIDNINFRCARISSGQCALVWNAVDYKEEKTLSPVGSHACIQWQFCFLNTYCDCNIAISSLALSKSGSIGAVGSAGSIPDFLRYRSIPKL